MIHFARPGYLALLVLIPLMAWLEPRVRRRPAFLYSSTALLRGVAELSRSPGQQMLRWFRWLALASLIFALARPQLEAVPVHWSEKGRATVFVLDLSQSMRRRTVDEVGVRMPPMVALRRAFQQIFAAPGKGRLGLIGVASDVYILCPLTADVDYLMDQLQRVEAFEKDPERRLGRAIGAALAMLEDAGPEGGQIVVVTDAGWISDSMDCVHAAEAARTLQIPISVIALPPSAGIQGTEAPGAGTLQTMVRHTGGSYTEVSTLISLESVLARLLEGPKTGNAPPKPSFYYRYIELYPVLLGMGLAFLLLEVFLTHTVWMRLP